MFAKIGIAVGVCLSLFVVVIAAAVGAVVSMFAGGAGSVACAPADSEPGVMAGYEREQLSSAATIVAVGQQMNVPQQGWVVALATAIQESGLRNLDTVTATASDCSSNARHKAGAARNRS